MVGSFKNGATVDIVIQKSQNLRNKDRELGETQYRQYQKTITNGEQQQQPLNQQHQQTGMMFINQQERREQMEATEFRTQEMQVGAQQLRGGRGGIAIAQKRGQIPHRHWGRA